MDWVRVATAVGVALMLGLFWWSVIALLVPS